MSRKMTHKSLPMEKLRWRLDPSDLSFKTTHDLDPLKDIIGQEKGVEALEFGIHMNQPGYNIFVTGPTGVGRRSAVKKVIGEFIEKSRPKNVPLDLCYVNAFKNPQTPILISLKNGTGRKFQKDVQTFIKKLTKLKEFAPDKPKSFLTKAKEIAAPLYKKYPLSKVQDYLEDMIEDIITHPEIFLSALKSKKNSPESFRGEGIQNLLNTYGVNLLVDNHSQKKPPVIFETSPTPVNLFGNIEHTLNANGEWQTECCKIKAGSIAKANGGFLILNMREVLGENGVLKMLKRVMESNSLEIQPFDPFNRYHASRINPEPIQLNLKFILIGNSQTYHRLLSWDGDLKRILKVRADFNSTLDINRERILEFSRFIKKVSDDKNLMPFDRSGVSALIEHAVRLAGRREKISNQLPLLADIICEADYWAKKKNLATISEAHVDDAISVRRRWLSQFQDSVKEKIDSGIIMIDMEGEKIGQINGLVVFNMGDIIFGRPTRITAVTSLGRKGIINIERDVNLAGKLHNKGTQILIGYLRNKYGQDKPLTLDASIAFEQSYGPRDGDSASSTTLYVLLSSLSKTPIRQTIAVTGSVNQKGEIQAVGAVNEKIEGFFDCCMQKGLTGTQGVMIPHSNENDLMLRKDLLAAVRKKKFHIYSVKTIDEGIEVLTGKRAGIMNKDGKYPKDSINYLVDFNLRKLAEDLKNFGTNNGRRSEDKEKRENKKVKKK